MIIFDFTSQKHSLKYFVNLNPNEDIFRSTVSLLQNTIRV